MAPSKLKLTIYRGDSFPLVYRAWADADKTEPVSLEGATFVAELREEKLTAAGELTEPVAAFVVDDTRAAEGEITFTLPPEVTRTLPSRGYWDLQQTLNGVVTTILTGSFKVQDDVSE